MIFVNKQLDKFKDENGDTHIYKMHEAFPHLYSKNDVKHSDFFVWFDDKNENLIVETTIEDSKAIEDRVKLFIRQQKENINREQQNLRGQLAVNEKRLKAMNAVLSDRGLKEFTKADCCRTMYAKLPEGEISNKGKVGIISMDCLSKEYRKPEYQLFRLEGGFGCSPTNGGNACFGKFCADGSEARMERFDFLGIANAEVEKIAEELEAGWSGGASGCAVKEREPDEPEM